MENMENIEAGNEAWKAGIERLIKENGNPFTEGDVRDFNSLDKGSVISYRDPHVSHSNNYTATFKTVEVVDKNLQNMTVEVLKNGEKEESVSITDPTTKKPATDIIKFEWVKDLNAVK